MEKKTGIQNMKEKSFSEKRRDWIEKRVANRNISAPKDPKNNYMK